MSSLLNLKILNLGANGEIGKVVSGALNGSIALDWRNTDSINIHGVKSNR